MNPAEDPDYVDAEIVNERVTAFHNMSISTNASGIKANVFLLAWGHVKCFIAAIILTLVVAVGFYYTKQFMDAEQHVPGVLLLLLTLAIGLVCGAFWLYGVLSCRQGITTIEKGLLGPGVVSGNRKSLLCLANVSFDEEETIYGLVAIDYKPRRRETEVCCASTFLKGKSADHYGTFTPVPLWTGSSDRAGITACRKRISSEMWDGLRKVAPQVEVPNFREMLLLNESFEVYDKVTYSTFSTDDEEEEEEN